MTRKRSLFRRVTFGCLVNLLVLLLLYFGLEYWAWVKLGRPENTYLAVQHEVLHHAWPPSSRRSHPEWIAHNPDFPEPYEHRYNAQCWIRDGDVSREKPPGTFRIFYVGDSFTEGCVPMDQNVPTVVETALDGALRPHGVRVEAIDTGTTSYSPTIELVLIRRILVDYSPDLIVLCIDMTDEYDDWKYSFDAVLDAEGLPESVPPTWKFPYADLTVKTVERTAAQDANVSVFHFSPFYQYLRTRSPTPPRTAAPDRIPLSSTGEKIYQRWLWCRDEWDDPLTESNARRTLRLVAEIARFCRRTNIGLLITGVPHFEQFAKDANGKPLWSDRPLRELARVAREEQVEYLDAFTPLRPALEGQPDGRYYYVGDMHFNPRGNALWAKEHVKALADPARRLLPESFYPRLSNLR